LIVAELDFIDARGETFDNGPDLASLKGLGGDVFEQRDHG
jgi:hypothetical protein